MRFVHLTIAALLTGCVPFAGPILNNNGCHYVLSGGYSESGSCQAFGGNNGTERSFTVAASGGSFSGAIIMGASGALTTGTYNIGNVPEGAGQLHEGNAAWAFVLNASGGDPANQGDFTLELDDTGPVTDGSTSQAWLSPHGTLKMNLPAVPNSGTSGVVQASLTF